MAGGVSDMSNVREFHLLVLPGDGIGPEIVAQTLRVVDWFGDHLGVSFDVEQAAVGGASIDECGVPISDAVMEKARRADAVLFGAVGGPDWDDLPRALATVTTTPAHVTGLGDRGRLAVGLRGDLLRVGQLGDTPVMRAAWSRGIRVG